ncbi:hypothetical protein BSLA_01r0018 [Burkholderia stabilis]|nr:hypothetical protein BSLA_01r0018 [Burkholderia stabilis]
MSPVRGDRPGRRARARPGSMSKAAHASACATNRYMRQSVAGGRERKLANLIVHAYDDAISSL